MKTESELKRVAQYVDFVNFSSLVPHGRSWPMLALLFGCGLWAGVSLVQAWWHAANAGKAAMRLAWAAAITWTLLLNAYVPIYDTTLVVLSILIADGALQDSAKEPVTAALNLFSDPVDIYVASWFTPRVSPVNLAHPNNHSPPGSTLALFNFGHYAGSLCGSAWDRGLISSARTYLRCLVVMRQGGEAAIQPVRLVV